MYFLKRLLSRFYLLDDGNDCQEMTAKVAMNMLSVSATCILWYGLEPTGLSFAEKSTLMIPSAENTLDQVQAAALEAALRTFLCLLYLF